MKSHKLPAVLAHRADLTHDVAFVTVEEPDVVVREIGNEQKPLRLVGRKGHATGGTALARSWRQNEFLHELSLLGGDLDAIRHPIGGVDQPVLGYIEREVASELLGHRSVGGIFA